MKSNNVNNDKRDLTAKEKLQQKKWMVYPLLVLPFLGSMWLIFSPTNEAHSEPGLGEGFNTTIPMPKEEGIVNDKESAYEEQELREAKKEKLKSLHDFTDILGKSQVSQVKDDTSDVCESTEKVNNPVSAYRNINQSLGNFYDRPKEDPEKARLKNELSELKEKLEEKTTEDGGVAKQLRIMEESYKMAAKYLPKLDQGNSKSVVATADSQPEVDGKSSKSIEEKTPSVRVSIVEEQIVSSLPQQRPEEEVIDSVDSMKQNNFVTPVASSKRKFRNSIKVCIYEDQVIVDEQNVRLRLIEPIVAGDIIVPKNAVLSGRTKLKNERLEIVIHSIEHLGNIIPVTLTAFDTDGQKGIFIPGSAEVNAMKEVASNMGNTTGSSINFSKSAGQEITAELGKGLIQGGSQYISKKISNPKVHLKAGYQLLLLPTKQ